MDITIDNLRRLFVSLKTITWIQRLISWRRIRCLLPDALGELERLRLSETILKQENGKLEINVQKITATLDMSRDALSKVLLEFESLKTEAKRDKHLIQKL